MSSEQPDAAPPPEDPDDAADATDEPVPTQEEIAAELAAVPLEEERRYPSTIGGLFYLLVLAATAVGIGVVWYGDWRLGVRFLAGALCVASGLRLVLPQRDAGMLAVRNRFFDATLLAGVGIALFFLTATIPDQPS